MKVNLLSDLHTEFWSDLAVHPGEGDVLILAGDIGLALTLKTTSGRYYREFLKTASESYNKVFYVLGNHEYYDYTFEDTLTDIQEFVYDNFTVLNNSSEFYNGVHFVGATLWTGFDKANPVVMKDAGDCMNDYDLIILGEDKLHPEDTLWEHNNSVEWFNQVLPTLNGDVVMITHHAPSIQSIKGRYDREMTKHAYHTDLTRLIANHPNLKVWCHGHTHVQNDYKVQQCRVLSNPFGYDGYELNKSFCPIMEFEV